VHSAASIIADVKRLAFPFAVLLLVVAALTACGAEESKAKPLSVAGEKLYPLKGKILSRDAADGTLRVDHEAIPGFMEAMTMDYSVRGANVEGLPPDGTRVEAKLHVANDGYWLTDVKKVP
jgi:protein SCO1/2